MRQLKVKLTIDPPVNMLILGRASSGEGQGSLAAKPGSLTFEQAAAVPMAAVSALQGLRAGGIAPGQRVLIIGVCGGVGTFAVQIARHLRATVTGVCSTRHVDVVRRLGAEAVIDYTTQDFTSGTARYDLALQLGGTYSPAAIRKVLTPGGTLIQSFGDGSRWFGPVGNIIKAVALNALAGQTLKSHRRGRRREPRRAGKPRGQGHHRGQATPAEAATRLTSQIPSTAERRARAQAIPSRWDNPSPVDLRAIARVAGADASCADSVLGS